MITIQAVKKYVHFSFAAELFIIDQTIPTFDYPGKDVF